MAVTRAISALNLKNVHNFSMTVLKKMSKVTYPVRAAEHVKYEYFILDMMIHGDTLAIYNIFDFYNNYN